MAIARELLSAYEATDFVVFEHGKEWILKVGAPSPRIDALLDRFGADRAIVVTAFNPRSQVLRPEMNEERHGELGRLLGVGRGVAGLIDAGRSLKNSSSGSVAQRPLRS